jgi:hypothetical protein
VFKAVRVIGRFEYGNKFCANSPAVGAMLATNANSVVHRQTVVNEEMWV